ncbi:energy transducer TonB [Pontibacter ramchanderi]|uniref:TonB family protein n=1 Tax=Pontibacter ramchanderi TaxID=1179743 RepID=A0A2N3UCW1_9BACT|nr:energy transducer TonB [Pontibacter ramchanderi]PKV67203.1 TonB family protein [Pontibacter ramchanderi]
MKNIYSFLAAAVVLLCGHQAAAQTVKIKYLSAMQKEVPATQAYYFEEIKEDSLGGGTRTRYLVEDSSKVRQIHYSDIDGGTYGFGIQHGPVYEWYPNGQLKLEMAYHDNKWDGPYTTWYENGRVRLSSRYSRGTVTDTLKAYYETGALRRVEVYQQGKMVSGEVYDESGKGIDFVPMEVMPEFPGGEKVMLRWIGTVLKYPKTTRKAKAEGLVIISFIVDEQGRIGDTELIRGIHPDADAEGMRVIKAMPTWKPGLQEGKPVPVRYTLPLRFSLR